MLARRPFLATLGALALPAAHALPERTLRFPRDHGAHPDLRTEWWYITGAVRSGEREFGFQLTFFRSRVDAAQRLASRFAARQLVFGHAAITDLQGRRLWHDQRIAREGFGIAQAETGDTRVRLRDWSLQRGADGGYTAVLPAEGFALDLRFEASQPLLLQGREGLSRKGPDPEQASYYYSVPQLRATGTLALQGRRFEVAGKAWLDHEWSEALLHPQAVGWDWIGMNLDDGNALTAFQLRRADGSALWDGGSFRTADGRTTIGAQGEHRFTALRRWTSPASKATYPVEWTVQAPGGTYTVRALLDHQELDSRTSTGGIYWEGLSDLLDASGRRVGRGYLEMTGYAQPLRL
ncbi:MAG TPA: carotenoid 1,2-hydratase [Ramlibacter sp.]|nr:carotenoid 1,2-hydratase [Ramlibacter sp.]